VGTNEPRRTGNPNGPKLAGSKGTRRASRPCDARYEPTQATAHSKRTRSRRNVGVSSLRGVKPTRGRGDRASRTLLPALRAPTDPPRRDTNSQGPADHPNNWLTENG
jgi:hypothetical protein